MPPSFIYERRKVVIFPQICLTRSCEYYIQDGRGKPQKWECEEQRRRSMVRARIFLIDRPLCRVEADVFADAIEIILIPDYVLVVIALPERLSRSLTHFVHPLRCRCLESTDDCSDGLGGRTKGRVFPGRIDSSYGRTAVRPNGNVDALSFVADDQNSMDMIRHNYELIERHIRPQLRSPHPLFLRNLPDLRQVYFLVPDRPQRIFSTVRMERDKIFPALRVIIPLQPDRSPTLLTTSCRQIPPMQNRIFFGFGAQSYLFSTFFIFSPLRSSAGGSPRGKRA
jgi:hypothetical protein